MESISYREGFEAHEFIALAQQVWPRDYSLVETQAALGVTVNIGARAGETLVGSIRILTDGYFFATIPEILVAPAFQRRGIGEQLMHEALQRAPKHRFAFGAQPQSVAFFDRIGCARTLTGFVAIAPLRNRRDVTAI